MIGGVLELPVSDASSIEEPDHNLEHVSPVQHLASVASGAKLFRSNDGRFFARVPVGDRFEVYGLKSAAFRDWLIHGYLINQPEPPSQVAIRRAVGMLEARARFDAGIPEVFVRTGRLGDGQGSTYFVDLGDPSDRAVAIRDRGWFAVDRPDVHFRRPEGLLPLPMPGRDGSIDQQFTPSARALERDRRLHPLGRSERPVRFLAPAPIPLNRFRGEDEFWRAFQADRPAILGAVFDAIVGGLRELASVHLAELPRMADYAIWGEAVGRGLGWGVGMLLST